MTRIESTVPPAPRAAGERPGEAGPEHVAPVAARVLGRLANGGVPAHELIRRDAAAHPGRTYSEHIEASRRIAGARYREDLARISPAANAALSRELEEEEMGL